MTLETLLYKWSSSNQWEILLSVLHYLLSFQWFSTPISFLQQWWILSLPHSSFSQWPFILLLSLRGPSLSTWTITIITPHWPSHSMWLSGKLSLILISMTDFFSLLYLITLAFQVGHIKGGYDYIKFWTWNEMLQRLVAWRIVIEATREGNLDALMMKVEYFFLILVYGT